MAKINLPFHCTNCGKDMIAGIDMNPIVLAPKIKGDLEPVGIPYKYLVTSEDIKKFIMDTSRLYVPDVQMEIYTRFCEKKVRKGSNEPHRSYAFFKIAFSHHIITDYSSSQGWFQQLGESGENVNIKSPMRNLFDRWSYNKNDLNEWTKSYKKMERLEDAFGMTEEYINDLKKFSKPRGIKVTGGTDVWVFFSASPERILQDFFENTETNAPAGKLSVSNPRMVSKDIIEYEVIVDPYQVETKINPHVQQILSSEEKF